MESLLTLIVLLILGAIIGIGVLLAVLWFSQDK